MPGSTLDGERGDDDNGNSDRVARALSFTRMSRRRSTGGSDVWSQQAFTNMQKQLQAQGSVLLAMAKEMKLDESLVSDLSLTNKLVVAAPPPTIGPIIGAGFSPPTSSTGIATASGSVGTALELLRGAAGALNGGGDPRTSLNLGNTSPAEEEIFENTGGVMTIKRVSTIGSQLEEPPPRTSRTGGLGLVVGGGTTSPATPAVPSGTGTTPGASASSPADGSTNAMKRRIVPEGAGTGHLAGTNLNDHAATSRTGDRSGSRNVEADEEGADTIVKNEDHHCVALMEEEVEEAPAAGEASASLPGSPLRVVKGPARSPVVLGGKSDVEACSDGGLSSGSD